MCKLCSQRLEETEEHSGVRAPSLAGIRRGEDDS